MIPALRAAGDRRVGWATARGLRQIGCVIVCAMALAVAAPATWAQGEGAAASFAADDGAFQWRAAFKLIALTAHAHPGEVGYLRDGDDTRESTEQSLRIQLTGQPVFWLDWRLDYLNVKQDLGTAAPAGARGAERFRYKPWRRDLLAPADAASTQTVYWYHEIDHAFVRAAAGPLEAVVGRQPISWGAGRVWQPTDAFATFSPLALDTEYKPGVDGVLLTAYPFDFTSVALAHVLSPADEPEAEDSTALRVRGAVGEQSEYTLMAGSVRGERRAGGSFETVLWEAGWRLEAVASREEGEDAARVFGIAGVDYRFDDGTLFVLEIYRNTRGAAREAELAAVAASAAYQEGRLAQLSATVLALSASRDFLGLWTATYTVFGAALRDAQDERRGSVLHQVTFTYSISDEAEAVFSFSGGSGKGMVGGLPRSEFGHVPDALYVALQFVL